MALLKCKIPPEQDGYGVQDGAQVAQTKLDGGASRYRRDVVGATAAIHVRWSVDPAGYEYLRALYTLTGAVGLPFLVDLILESRAPAEREAHFASPIRLAGQKGLSYVVEADLEVTPVPLSDAAATAIVNGYTP